jgi:PAS domain S-box-containing protein
MGNQFQPQLTHNFAISLSELSKIIDSLNDAAFLIEDRNIVNVNSKATQLTSFTRQELIRKPVTWVIKNINDISQPSQTDQIPQTKVFNAILSTRNGKKFVPNARLIHIKEKWGLIILKPFDEKYLQSYNEEDTTILSRLLEIIKTGQINNPEQALLKSLEAGKELLETSILAIYVGNSQKPSARRVAFSGDGDAFPAEIFSLDIKVLNKATIWFQSQKSIVSFLHQEARAAGLSYLATCPIGNKDSDALVGILVAGGYQSPPPENFLEHLKILGEILSGVINKSVLITNLQASIEENNQTISILESAKNLISDGVILVNKKLQIAETNQSAEVVLGYNAFDMHGVEISEIFIGTDRLIPAIDSALQGISTPNLGNINIHRRDGSEFPVEIGTFPVHHQAEILGAIVIIKDLSEHKQIQIRTQQLEQRALLGEVTSIFAHEVRNPINNISTGLQLMAEELHDDDSQIDAISRILQDCNRLDGLMESVLTFSRTGNYDFVPLSIEELIERLLKLWAPRIKRLKIEYYTAFPPKPIEVIGDRRALEQVFTNIISNAIQVMEEMGSGTLAIRVSPIKWINERPTVQIDISDTGPGISADIHRRIFEPFFTTKKNGTGLGLAISKQIITAHKGSINLTTFPGGTVFHVKLPARLNEETK